MAQSGSAPRSHRGGQGFKSPQLHPSCRVRTLAESMPSEHPLRRLLRLRVLVWISSVRRDQSSPADVLVNRWPRFGPAAGARSPGLQVSRRRCGIAVPWRDRDEHLLSAKARRASRRARHSSRRSRRRPRRRPRRLRQRRARSVRSSDTASSNEREPPDLPPAPSSTSSRVGRLASAISRERRYSCKDWCAAAARCRSTACTSSGTSLMCTGHGVRVASTAPNRN